MRVMVSGGFDPMHVGHLEMLQRANNWGSNKVIVALNSDEWLLRKKGYIFMPFKDRKALLEANRYVNVVVDFDDSDGTACDAIRKFLPDVFANGGDRGPTNTPETELCKKLGIDTWFDLGSKIASSSIIAKQRIVERDWGTYEVIYEGPKVKVKVLRIKPNYTHTEQKHEERIEDWFYPSFGTSKHIMQGEWHRIENPTNEWLEILEVQRGICREDDIERRP